MTSFSCDPVTSTASGIVPDIISLSRFKSHHTNHDSPLAVRLLMISAFSLIDSRLASLRSDSVSAFFVNNCPGNGLPNSMICSVIFSGGMVNPLSSNPNSDGFDSMTAQEQIHFQKFSSPWPFNLQVPTSDVSLIKNKDSISGLVNTFKNSEWFPNSTKSFGAGVAVHASLKGVFANDSMI